MKYNVELFLRTYVRMYTFISNCCSLSELESDQYGSYGVTLKSDVDKLRHAIGAMRDLRSRGLVCRLCRHGDESTVYQFERQESVKKKYDNLPIRSMDRPPNHPSIQLLPIQESVKKKYNNLPCHSMDKPATHSGGRLPPIAEVRLLRLFRQVNDSKRQEKKYNDRRQTETRNELN